MASYNEKHIVTIGAHIVGIKMDMLTNTLIVGGYAKHRMDIETVLSTMTLPITDPVITTRYRMHFIFKLSLVQFRKIINIIYGSNLNIQSTKTLKQLL